MPPPTSAKTSMICLLFGPHEIFNKHHIRNIMAGNNPFSLPIFCVGYFRWIVSCLCDFLFDYLLFCTQILCLHLDLLFVLSFTFVHHHDANIN